MDCAWFVITERIRTEINRHRVTFGPWPRLRVWGAFCASSVRISQLPPGLDRCHKPRLFPHRRAPVTGARGDISRMRNLDSRRLTGPNLHRDGAAAIAEVAFEPGESI